MVRLVDLFVFDLAGTVVVDDRQVLRAFLATTGAFDLPVDEARLRGCMGWHKERVFATLLAEAGRETAAAPAMARQFEQEYAGIVRCAPLRPTPGALDALRRLEQGGIAVAFNTGFARGTADLVLRAIGRSDSVSIASDEVARGRPAPDLIQAAMARCGVDDPQRVGVAGDTPADLAAGIAAGVRLVVGVGCGTHTLDELRRHPHTHLLADLRPLPELLLDG